MKIRISQKGVRWWTPLDDIWDPDSASGPLERHVSKAPDPVPAQPDLTLGILRDRVKKLWAEGKITGKEMKELVEMHGREKVVAVFRDLKKEEE